MENKLKLNQIVYKIINTPKIGTVDVNFLAGDEFPTINNGLNYSNIKHHINEIDFDNSVKKQYIGGIVSVEMSEESKKYFFSVRPEKYLLTDKIGSVVEQDNTFSTKDLGVSIFLDKKEAIKKVKSKTLKKIEFVRNKIKKYRYLDKNKSLVKLEKYLTELENRCN